MTRKIISIVLLVAITALGISFFLKNREDFQLITSVSIYVVLLLAGIQFLSTIGYGLQFKILTDHYKLKLNFPQWYGLIRTSAFSDLWLPTGGGTSLKAIYLKRIHNLKYSSFVASAAITNVIKLSVNSLLAFILLWAVKTKAPMLLFWTIFFFFLGTVIVLIFAHRVKQDYLPALRVLQNMGEEWRKFRKDHETLMKLIGINCGIFMTAGLQVYFAFSAFSVHISLVTSGLIAALSIITRTINLIPGNWGVRELIVVALSGLDGITVNEGLHAAALSRIIEVALTLILAPGFFYNLSKEKAFE
ncbi:MAG: lysylphosphatidylglycerol synthase transmembrane domain-containing protein [Nitrospirota bacterium]